MFLEPLMKRPIKIRLSSLGNDIIMDYEKNDILPLNPGVLLGGEHYGFSLIIDKDGEQVEELYPTQCKIGAIGIQDKRIIVLEEGKTRPWAFTLSGDFIEPATFLDVSKRDIDYIYDNLGPEESKKVDEVNKKAYQKHL